MFTRNTSADLSAVALAEEEADVTSERRRINHYYMSHKHSHSFIAEIFFGSVFTLVALAVFVLPVGAHIEMLTEPEVYIDPNPVAMCAALQCRAGQPTDFKVFLEQADQDSLDLLVGTKLEPAMDAIAKSAYKYQVPVGFFTGIAHAESGVHEHYYLESDKERCHNAWGLKPSTGVRSDGSYLICFESWEAGTEYFGKLLREGYLDNGARTVDIIAPYYKCGGPDGEDWCLATADNWIRNVKAFAIF